MRFRKILNLSLNFFLAFFAPSAVQVVFSGEPFLRNLCSTVGITPSPDQVQAGGRLVVSMSNDSAVRQIRGPVLAVGLVAKVVSRIRRAGGRSAVGGAVLKARRVDHDEG